MLRRLPALSAALVLVAVVVGASPAVAHERGAAVAGGRGWREAVGVTGLGGVLLVATVVTVGLLVAAAVVGPSPRPGRTRRLQMVMAIAAASCDIVVLGADDPVAGVLGGWPRWLAIGHLALMLVVVAKLPRTGRLSGPATVALAGGLWLTVALSVRGGVLEAAVTAAHTGTAAVWVGLVVHLALGWGRGEEGRTWLAAARRCSPVAALAALVTAATGVVNMAVHGAFRGDLPTTAYGRVLLFKIALVLPAGVAAGALVRRWVGPARPRLRPLVGLVRAEAATFAVVIVLASVLPALARPGGDLAASLLGGFAIDGPDGKECTSRYLGRLVAMAEAGRRRPSPKGRPGLEVCGGVGIGDGGPRYDAIEAEPAQVGGAFVRFLAGRGAGRLLVVSDGSRRGQHLAGGAVTAAGATGVAVEIVDSVEPAPVGSDAVVVATGWDAARSVLAAIRSGWGGPTRGVYLAPWLLGPELLAGDANGPQVSIGMGFPPDSPSAVAYLEALRRLAPGAVPSGAGLAGYLEARRTVAPTTGGPSEVVPSRIEFFTPIRVGILPASLGAGHAGDGASRWLAGTTLAAIGGVALQHP